MPDLHVTMCSNYHIVRRDHDECLQETQDLHVGQLGLDRQDDDGPDVLPEGGEVN